jgi:hypothetical protein
MQFPSKMRGFGKYCAISKNRAPPRSENCSPFRISMPPAESACGFPFKRRPRLTKVRRFYSRVNLTRSRRLGEPRACGRRQWRPLACRGLRRTRRTARTMDASIICAAPPLLIWDMDWTSRGPRAKSVPKSLPESLPSRPTIKLQVFDDPLTSVCPIRAKSVPDQIRIWSELARMDGAETPYFRGSDSPCGSVWNYDYSKKSLFGAVPRDRARIPCQSARSQRGARVSLIFAMRCPRFPGIVRKPFRLM